VTPIFLFLDREITKERRHETDDARRFALTPRTIGLAYRAAVLSQMAAPADQKRIVNDSAAQRKCYTNRQEIDTSCDCFAHPVE
jgi:hypothetical protein